MIHRRRFVPSSLGKHAIRRVDCRVTRASDRVKGDVRLLDNEFDGFDRFAAATEQLDNNDKEKLN